MARLLRPAGVGAVAFALALAAAPVGAAMAAPGDPGEQQPAKRHYRVVVEPFRGPGAVATRASVVKALTQTSGVEVLKLGLVEQRGIVLDGSASAYVAVSSEFQLAAVISGEVKRAGRGKYRLQLVFHNGGDGAVLDAMEVEATTRQALNAKAAKQIRAKVRGVLSRSLVPFPPSEQIVLEEEPEEPPKKATEAQPPAKAEQPATPNEPKTPGTEGDGARAKPEPPEHATTLELRALAAHWTRSYYYAGEMRGALRTYRLTRAAAFGGQLRLYPAAALTQSFWGNVGLAARFEQMLNVTSQVVGVPLDTQSQSYSLGARVRIPLRPIELRAELDWGKQVFMVADTYVPDVDYRYLRLGANIDAKVWRIVAGLSLGARMLLDTGELRSGAWFPHSNVPTALGTQPDGVGFDIDAHLGYAIVEQLHGLIGLSWQHYRLSLNPLWTDTSPNGVATTALDTYLSTWLGLELRL